MQVARLYQLAFRSQALQIYSLPLSLSIKEWAPSLEEEWESYPLVLILESHLSLNGRQLTQSNYSLSFQDVLSRVFCLQYLA